MKWNFTCEEVTSGKVKYSIEEFRKDLFEEVRDNFPEYNRQQLESVFRIAYDVCYCTAVRQDLDELLKHLKSKGVNVDRKYLELIRDCNLENIEMLKAVFARKLTEFQAEGLSSKDALKKLEKLHKKLLKSS